MATPLAIERVRIQQENCMSVQKKCLVATSCGKIEGVFENGLYVFRGIPYAAPPVGDLRWLPPQPPIPWAGVRAATEYGPIAPQNIMPVPMFLERPEPQSEDCLFLNVYSPGLDTSRRPVMVWIHGGAFSIGSGSMQMFRKSTIASNGNVVLVTINYRLGALGFLNLNELTKGRIPCTGNEGLQDQVAALRWVRDNIADFGGNPDNVTLFGESAGAMSVGCQLAMSEAQGLFHKAILESAVGEMARTRDASVQIAEMFLRIAGVRAEDVSSLHSLPVGKLLQAQQETAVRTGQGAAPFIPVADGAVILRMPLCSLESGSGSRVPVLVGSNLEEDKFFAMMTPGIYAIEEEGLRTAAARFVAGRDVSKLIDAYRKARAKRGEPTTPFEILSAISTDVLFRKTAIRIAEAQCRNGAGGYNYLFCWRSPAAGGRLGACHVLEVGFVFGNYDARFCGRGPEADQLSREMQESWTSFARNGNPSCSSLGQWPQYSDGRATMIFDRKSRVEKAVYEEERRVWETLISAPT
jgi:para-nitrobenzyl esterase